MANLKTVKKWQETLNCKLDVLEIADGKVNRIKCVVCSKYEDRNKSMKGFSKTWTDGTESVKKELGKIYKEGLSSKSAWLRNEVIYGCIILSREIILSTPIGRGLSKMLEGDKEVSLRTTF